LTHDMLSSIVERMYVWEKLSQKGLRTFHADWAPFWAAGL
jgi:hypothetical protein